MVFSLFPHVSCYIHSEEMRKDKEKWGNKGDMKVIILINSILLLERNTFPCFIILYIPFHYSTQYMSSYNHPISCMYHLAMTSHCQIKMYFSLSTEAQKENILLQNQISRSNNNTDKNTWQNLSRVMVLKVKIKTCWKEDSILC